MNIVVLHAGAIGDALLTFPVLTALREKYPNTHITLAAQSAVLPLAQAWGIAEDVSNYEERQWDEPFSSAGVRNSNLCDLFQRTDLAICCQRTILDVLKQNLFAAGVKKVIIAYLFDPENASKHVIEYLAESLGLEHVDKRSVVPNPGWSNDLCLYNPPVAIHPGSADEKRRWPAASFAALINRLLRLEQPVLLLAGSADTEQLREMRMHLSPPFQSGLLTILKNAPLLEVTRRIKQCKCFLGNNSGIMHLAALAGVPTLALFTTGYVDRYYPLGPKVEVIQDEEIKRISMERVFASIQKYL